MKLYIYDKAVEIVELFEDVLDKYGIVVPSPEDDERGPDNEAKLYGTVYGDLLDEVARVIVETLDEAKAESTSGTKGQSLK